jgi:WD40 repeat protein
MPVEVVAWSADATLVASAGALAGKPTIVLRDAAGAVKGTILGHEAAVASLAFSADKTRLVSGSADKTARVWDLSDPKYPELVKFEGHAAAVTAVAFSPDAATVFSGSADNALRQWKTADGEEMRALAGHTGAVTSLTVAAATVISGSADATVRVWNIADGAAARNLSHGGAVTQVAVSPDGKWIASAGVAGEVKLVERRRRTAGPMIAGHAAPVACVRFSGDSTRLATVSTDGVRIWQTDGLPLERFALTDPPIKSVALTADNAAILAVDAAGGFKSIAPALVRAIAAHPGGAAGVAFSADGAQVASGGADKTVKLWNIADGAAARSFAGPVEAVTGVDISVDGKLLVASTADGKVFGWPLPAAAEPAPATFTATLAAPVRGIAAGADAARLATGGDDGLVRVWDTATGKELERFAGHDGPVLAVAMAADNATVVSGGADNSARAWKTSASAVFLADATKVSDAGFFPDGSKLATAGAEMLVKLWDVEGKPAGQLAGAKAALAHLAVRPDGAQVAAVDAEGRLMLWTTANSALTHTVETGAAAADLAYSRDNEKVALAGADKHLRVYDPADGTLLQELAAETDLHSVCFAPTGREIFTGAASEGALWAYAAPAAVLSLAGHEGNIYGIACDGDGKLAASAGSDAVIRIWDLATGQQVKQLAGHAGAVYGVRFSDDGKQLLSAGIDGTARLWDVAAGSLLKQFVPETLEGEAPAPLFDAALSPDGALIAAAGPDKKVRLWTAAGQLSKTLEGHADAVYRLAFSPKGNRLLSCGHAGAALVWDVAGGQQLFTAAAPSVLYDACYSPDGARISLAGADGRVFLYALPAAAQ